MHKSFAKLTKIWHRKSANSSISTTPLWFDDSYLKNAFEYLEVVHIARN